MKLLPVDSIVLTYGFGAEPVRAVILSYRSGGYVVGREGDTSVTQTITNEDIVDVIDDSPLVGVNTPQYSAHKANREVNLACLLARVQLGAATVSNYRKLVRAYNTSYRQLMASRRF